MKEYHTFTEKLVCHVDGFGFKVQNRGQDEGVKVSEFYDISQGKVAESEDRYIIVYGSEALRELAGALLELAREIDEYDNFQEEED